MMDHKNNNDYLTMTEAATLAGYSADYFRRCVCHGKPLGGLKPPQVVTLGVHRYIRRDVMERWLANREKPQEAGFASHADIEGSLAKWFSRCTEASPANKYLDGLFDLDYAVVLKRA